MRPTRRTQPYRKGPGQPRGVALANMKRGRTIYGHNPADVQRLASKRAARRRRRLRA
jgi:hypothetical protein